LLIPERRACHVALAGSSGRRRARCANPEPPSSLLGNLN
jgi:hypothetical protein